MSVSVRLDALAAALGARDFGGAETIELPVDAPRWFGAGAPLRRYAAASEQTPDMPCAWITQGPPEPPITTPWLAVTLDEAALAWRLQRALDRLADGTGMPGTLVRIGNHGVVLTGSAGSGKSHAALELLHRGHALVSDDLIRLETAGNRLTGRAPEQGRGRLAVRQLGTIDVTAHFGDGAVSRSAEPALIVELDANADADGLDGGWEESGLLGRPLPRLRLSPGPMIATVIEVALQESILRRGGRGGAPAWIREQQEAIRCD